MQPSPIPTRCKVPDHGKRVALRPSSSRLSLATISRAATVPSFTQMKLRKIKCPLCNERVEFDCDAGDKQTCSECDGEVVINVSKSRKRRRRTGVMLGSEVFGTSAQDSEMPEQNEEVPINRKARRLKSKKMKVVQSTHVSGADGRSFAVKAVVDVENEDEINALRGRKFRIRRKAGLAFFTMGVIVTGSIFLKQLNPTKSDEKAKDGSGESANGQPSKDAGDKASSEVAAKNQMLELLMKNEAGGSIDGAPVKTLSIPEQRADRNRLASTAANAFLDADSLEKRLALIRNAEVLRPVLTKYYETRDPGPIAHRRMDAVGVESPDLRYISFSVELPGGVKRALELEYTGNGYLVDWPSFVIYSEMRWSVIKREKPNTPTRIRILARSSDHYKSGFEERLYASYQISHPTKYESSIFGYVSRGSEAHQRLESFEELRQGKALPLVLDISYPQDATADNVILIHHVISNGWMIRQ